MVTSTLSTHKMTARYRLLLFKFYTKMCHLLKTLSIHIIYYIYNHIIYLRYLLCIIAYTKRCTLRNIKECDAKLVSCIGYSSWLSTWTTSIHWSDTIYVFVFPHTGRLSYLLPWSDRTNPVL